MKRYINENNEISFCTQIRDGGKLIINPSREKLESLGWRLIEEDEIAPVQTYGEVVNDLIRCRYTLSEELAILRQRDDKPQEFEEYFNFCEYCKREALK